MKKIMLIAAMMVMTIAAKAQNAVGQLTLKPMVGMTAAYIANSSAEAKVGLAAGAELECGIADNLGITAGAVYAMQGNKDGDIKWNLEYINIPILANYYVAPGFAIKAGLQPAFNVNDDDNSLVNTFDLSIPVGLSYEISDFVIDARYQWGLTKIIDNTDLKNSVVMISIGYKFGL